MLTLTQMSRPEGPTYQRLPTTVLAVYGLGRDGTAISECCRPRRRTEINGSFSDGELMGKGAGMNLQSTQQVGDAVCPVSRHGQGEKRPGRSGDDVVPVDVTTTSVAAAHPHVARRTREGSKR